MGTKELGRVDPTGNYGMSQAEADKARKWAAERKAARIKAGRPAGPRVRAADWRAHLDAKYPHGFKGGQGAEVAPKSVTHSDMSVTAEAILHDDSVTSVTTERDSVTVERDSVTPETRAERRKRMARERQARGRAAKRKQ